MTEHLPAAPESRQIRVFLSSTFRDFMEERDLLVKQVFPSLRRRAQERGVEVVDVDLRWGVTEEESQQGKVIGICLAEIERCRPYFIGMLGERYGWIPPKDKYPAVVLEQQTWLQQHVGGASVTELEILHGVLNDPKMAGRAFFYFRDPAWSRAQREPGFVCDTPEEEAKLAALKDRILASNFPVKQGLPDPKAIADQIEADLWALIEEQYPDLDEADALEKEARKHASYRQSRLGVYLGQQYVDQLEALVSGGEQKILITGESGSGKSALIANWIHQHELENPGDVVYAHHLGCSNDASAIRPLLGRMLDTASNVLIEAALITEPIQVPLDWWELTAKLAETLQDLGRWCRKTGHRWIWVLDGLDRLAVEDQQALPWLPLLIPEGVSVVISALNCPARAILLERQFQLLEIGPLQRAEQKQLIETYLERYTKKLDADRLQQILACDLARSPLFLRVLLEELRQCGRFETLETQIADYIRPDADGSLAVNDLYAQVLARLESDCGPELVRKALTALWASRAGLTEPELVAITGLAPLQWVPIDLALQEALGRSANRLVFDHNYLRKAVEDRYLSTEEQRRQAHSELANWFGNEEEWEERNAEELPWQLQEANRLKDLLNILLEPKKLARMANDRGNRETICYWLAAKDLAEGRLDELIAEAVNDEINTIKDNARRLASFVVQIANILDEAGLHRELLLQLRSLSLDLLEGAAVTEQASLLHSMSLLAKVHRDMGHYDAAESLYLRCLDARKLLFGNEDPDTITTVSNLAAVYRDKGNYVKAEEYYDYCLQIRKRILGSEHPDTLRTVGCLGLVNKDNGAYEHAEVLLNLCLAGLERLMGLEHPVTIIFVNNLASLYEAMGHYEQSEYCYMRCFEGSNRVLGPDHPSTLVILNNLAGLLQKKGNHDQAETYFSQCLSARQKLLGPEHPYTLSSVHNLGMLYWEKGDTEKAKDCIWRCLEIHERLMGAEHPKTLTIVENLGMIYRDCGDLEQAKARITLSLNGHERLLGPDHPSTLVSVSNLGLIYSEIGDIEDAEICYRRCIEARERLLGLDHPDTLTSLNNLGVLLRVKGDVEQAELCYKRCLEGRERLLGMNHHDTIAVLKNLGTLYRLQGNYEQAIPIRRRELSWRRQYRGDSDIDALTLINELAIDLREIGDLGEAELLFRELVEGRQMLLASGDSETGRALAGLAKTLELKGKFEEAATVAKQAINCLLANQNPDECLINLLLLNLARLVYKLGRKAESLRLLKTVQTRITSKTEPDDDDRQLLADAAALRDQIEANP